MTSSGQARHLLKTAYRDGTTHIVLEPLDLMARLAALVPPPRMHLTRFDGVFAPHGKLHAVVTPALRGIGGRQARCTDEPVSPEQGPPPHHAAMSWARRLKRVFGIDIDRRARRAGKLRIIASIDEPAVIARILAHLDKTASEQPPELAPL